MQGSIQQLVGRSNERFALFVLNILPFSRSGHQDPLKSHA
jgi:hypothetical protein